MPKRLTPSQEENRRHVLARHVRKRQNRIDGKQVTLERLLHESAARFDSLPLVAPRMFGGWYDW